MKTLTLFVSISLLIACGASNNSDSAQLSEESDPIRITGTPDSNMYVQVTADEAVTVYTKTQAGNWIGYPLRHIVDSLSNYDSWSLIRADEFDRVDDSFVSSGRFPNKLMSAGVQEAAWRESGNTTDFIGGALHGDEVFTSIIMQVDGKLVNPTSETLLTACKDVRFVITSTVYSNNTPEQAAITRKRVYDFDNAGVSLDIQNTFLVDKTFTRLFHNALAYTVGTYNHYYVDKELIVNVIDGAERSIDDDVREYTLIGANVSAKVQVLDIDAGPIYPRFLISSTGKPYFDLINGSGGFTKAALAGDTWRIKSRYELTTFYEE